MLKIVGVAEKPSEKYSFFRREHRSVELQRIISTTETTMLPEKFKSLLIQEIIDFYEEYFGDKWTIKKKPYSESLTALNYSDITGKKEEKIKEIVSAIEEMAARIKQEYQHGKVVINFDDDNKEKKMVLNAEKVSEMISAVETAIMKENKQRIFKKEIEFDTFEEFLRETPLDSFKEISKEIAAIRRSI